jgi:hypothetical protein
MREEITTMRKITVSWLGLATILTMTLGFAAAARAQNGKMSAPPKILQITREYTKPGKGGAMHDKTESAFVEAMARAKWPTHYIGMTSLSGKSRALFFTGYDSFAAWEKDTNNAMGNASLSAALERASVADGELLTDLDQNVFIYREDQSLNPDVDLSQVRYFDISVFHVKEGREHDWDQATQLVKAAYEKSNPEVHWAVFQAAYGPPDGTYLVITPRKSLAEVDSEFSMMNKFMSALGEDGIKKLDDLSAEGISDDMSNLFAVNPRMSYVGDDIASGAPSFWRPKPMGAMPMAGKPKPSGKPAFPPPPPPNQ